MPALPSSLISSLSCVPAGVTVPETAAGLPAALAMLPDPRSRRGIRHRLTVVVTAAVCAVVAAGHHSIAAVVGGGQQMYAFAGQLADRQAARLNPSPAAAVTSGTTAVTAVAAMVQAFFTDRLIATTGQPTHHHRLP